MAWLLGRRRDGERGAARQRHPSATPIAAGDQPHWPIELRARTPSGVPILLRALTVDDSEAFFAVRRANREWLSPWDATSPYPQESPRTFRELVESYDEEARAGRSLPFVIERDGQLVGQLTLSTVVLGSFRSCSAGYWVAQASAGLGIASTALALAADHAFGVLRLHRIEVNIRPENIASLAVVHKLGFRDEGVRRLMLHIDGAWRDHRSFALTSEDLAGRTLRERLNHQSQ